MRQRGEELVLEPVAAFGLGARGAFAVQQPLALGDIGGDGDAHAVAILGDDAPLDFGDAAVGAHDRQRAFPAAAVGERPMQLAADLLVAGRDDIDAPLADDVVAVASRQPAELRVDVAKHQVRIEQCDAARGQLEDGAEARIGGALQHVRLAREQQRAHRGDQHRRIHRVREIAVAAGRESLQHVVVGDEGRRQVNDG